MSKSAEAFSINDRINHHVYGLGTISQVNERHTTIVFDLSGTRKFLTPVVRLERSATPAPPKVPRPRKAKAAKVAKVVKVVKVAK